MSSTLRAVIAYGRDLEIAMMQALNDYNKIDARKIFHNYAITEGLSILQEDQTYTARVIIWFTANIDDPVEPKIPEFIGSIGVDPNDPDWREKLASKKVWDKDRFQNASVRLQEDVGEAIATILNKD